MTLKASRHRHCPARFHAADVDRLAFVLSSLSCHEENVWRVRAANGRILLHFEAWRHSHADPELLRVPEFNAAGLALGSELVDESGAPVPDSRTLPAAVFCAIWTKLRDEISSQGARDDTSRLA